MIPSHAFLEYPNKKFTVSTNIMKCKSDFALHYKYQLISIRGLAHAPFHMLGNAYGPNGRKIWRNLADVEQNLGDRHTHPHCVCCACYTLSHNLMKHFTGTTDISHFAHSTYSPSPLLQCCVQSVSVTPVY